MQQGVAACTQPAHAEIVFTRTNLSPLGGFYAIDFNHDGVSDFSLYAYLSGNSSNTYNDLLKVGAKGAASVIGLEKGNALSAWDAPLDWSIRPNSPKPFQYRPPLRADAGGRSEIQSAQGTLEKGDQPLSGTEVPDPGGNALRLSAAGRRATASVDVHDILGRRLPPLGLRSLGAAGLSVWRRRDW